VLQTYDIDGKVINTYTYGVQRINSEGQDDETYLYDDRGSVVGTINQDNILTSYAYTAYGELMPKSPKPKVFGYNAEATDLTTGIQYLRARYYDTTINRFFQEDDYRGDFAEPITLHRYIYVGNNPVNRIDPSGYGWLSNAWNGVKSFVGNIFNKKNNSTTTVTVGSNNTSYPTPVPTPAPTPMPTPSRTMPPESKSIPETTPEPPRQSEPTKPIPTEPSPGPGPDAPLGGNRFNDDLACAMGGFLPVVGPVFDVADAVKSFKKGEYFWGVVSAIAIIPGIGDLIGLTKGLKVVNGVTDVAKTANVFNDTENAIDAINTIDAINGTENAINAGTDVAQNINEAENIINSGDEVFDGINAVDDKIDDAVEDFADEGVCFVAGILILTKNGYKNIEDIKAGDYVLSQDSITKEQGYQRVVRTFKNVTDTLLRISLDSEVILTTAEHPFWVENKGWVEASKLKIGSKISTADGESIKVLSVEVIELSELIVVYNFEVSDWHTYFVGDKGFLVHNNCSLDESVNQTFKSIKDSPNYPEGFEVVQNGTTKNTVKNKQLLEQLRKVESGTWQKVYKDGYDVYGNKVSIH